MSSLRITVYKDQELAFETICTSGIEVGRQVVSSQYSEPKPFAVCNHAKYGARLVVVAQTSNDVPRRCFRAYIDGDRVKLKNVHRSHPLAFSDGSTLAPNETIVLDDAPLLQLGSHLAIRVEIDDAESQQGSRSYRSLASQPTTPNDYKPQEVPQTLMQLVDAESGSLGSLVPKGGIGTARKAVDGDEWITAEGEGSRASKSDEPRSVPILNLLQKTLDVVREASGSDAFLAASVRAAGEIVGLDRVMLLVPGENDEWTTQANYERSGNHGIPGEVSHTLLCRVNESRLTQIYNEGNVSDVAESLTSLNCALASPVLDGTGNVIAVLYGDRSGMGFGGTGRINEIEATFVEILAGAVSAGLARKDEEARRSALVGFFSPRVADMLSSRPELLRPKEAEVSVLFCDIRGFSGITENAAPELTFDWLQDVLSEISQCVVDLDGVLVDYVGDQLFASWGAPDAQPDHHERALRAATMILESTDVLRARWAEKIDKPFSLGIGVSTGYAQAGNVGSRQKFKYGVLGNTVNLGSRLQDASKQLGVACVAESACIKGAGWESRSRRLTKLQVAGILGAVEAYEIVAHPDDDWLALTAAYHTALEQFEDRRFAEATATLGNLLQTNPHDRPCQILLNRAVGELANPTEPFSGVLTLTTK